MLAPRRAATVGLAALLALVGCGHRADLDSELERAIPGDAEIVAGANLDQLRDTPLWRAAPPGLVEPFREGSRVVGSRAARVPATLR